MEKFGLKNFKILTRGLPCGLLGFQKIYNFKRLSWYLLDMPITHALGNRLSQATPSPARPTVDQLLRQVGLEPQAETETETETETNLQTDVSTRLSKTAVALNRVNNPLTASMNELSSAQATSAELVKLSSVFHEKGAEAVRVRAERTLPGYTIDFDLTDDHALIAMNPKGKLEVAFRGTDPGHKIKSGFLKGMPEPIMWPSVWGGFQGLFDEHVVSKYGTRIREKYNRPVSEVVDHVQGYSMGGAKAYNFADMFGVNSTLFNVMVGKDFKGKQIHPEVTHNIVRTTSDIATFTGLVAAPGGQHSNIKVDSIDPVDRLSAKEYKGVQQALKDIPGVVVDMHSIDHFTEETRGETRGNVVRDALDRVDARSAEHLNNILTAPAAELPQLTADFHASNAADLSLINSHVEVNSAPLDPRPYSTGLQGVRHVTSTGLAVGAGLIASSAIDIPYQALAEHITILQNDTVHAAMVAGASEAAVQKAFIQRLASGATNFKTAIVSSMGQAVGAQQLEPLINDAFLNAGMSVGDASVWSQTTAGAVSAGVVTGVVEGVGVGFTAAATIAEVGLANAWNPVGDALLVAAGATAAATAVGAAFSWMFSSRKQRDHDVILQPFRNGLMDRTIATNPDIVGIIREFNKHGDFRPEKVKQVESRIQVIIDQQYANDEYGYKVHLVTAPKDTAMNGPVMLQGDYSNIPDRLQTAPIGEFYEAEGNALLQTQYHEYAMLTDAELTSLSNQLRQMHPDIPQDLFDTPNPKLRLGLLLSHNPNYEESISALREEYTDLEQRLLTQAQDKLSANIQDFITNSALAGLLNDGKYNEFNQKIHEKMRIPEVQDMLLEGVDSRYYNLYNNAIPQIRNDDNFVFTSTEGPVISADITKVHELRPEPGPEPEPEPEPETLVPIPS